MKILILMEVAIVNDSKDKYIYAGIQKEAACNNEFESGIRVRVWFEGNHIRTFENEQKEVDPFGECPCCLF